jgi:hypothetical protein
MSDTVELTLTLHHESRDAWLVSKDGKRQNAQWVPKAWGTMQVAGMSARLTISRARALEKRLL